MYRGDHCTAAVQLNIRVVCQVVSGKVMPITWHLFKACSGTVPYSLKHLPRGALDDRHQLCAPFPPVGRPVQCAISASDGGQHMMHHSSILHARHAVRS